MKKNLLMGFLLAGLLSISVVQAKQLSVVWVVDDGCLFSCQMSKLVQEKSEKWCVKYKPQENMCEIVTSSFISHGDLGLAFHACLTSMN